MTAPHDPTAPADAADATGPTESTALDPVREAALRRVLAEAAGPEPLPPYVATRLDDVLTGLVAERSTAPSEAPVPTVSHPEGHGVVVPLDAAARRRRVRVRVLLGAAAAVVAVGVGVGAINGVSQQRSDDVTAANEMAEEDPARSDEGEVSDAEPPAASQDRSEEAASPQEAGGETGDMVAQQPRRVVSDDPVREVRPERLREDLVALQHVTVPRAAVADYSRPTLSAPADFMCEPTAFGPGYLVGVEYAGKPAVVAFREPVGSTQAAEVLACGTGDVLHSTTLATTG